MMTRARDLNRVLARRKELGLHLTQLADASETHPSLISNVEGGFVPQTPTMQRIAKALDTAPMTLWPEEFGGEWCGCAVWCGRGCGFRKAVEDKA